MTRSTTVPVSLRLGALAGVLLVACSDDPNTAPEPQSLAVTLSTSHARITTPGRITLTAQSSEPLSRVEIHEGGRRVGESIGALDPHRVEIAVTAADNGTHAYVAKGYDAAGNLGTSASVTTEVDIRWDLIRAIGPWSSGLRLIAADAMGNLYVGGRTVPTEPGPFDYNAILGKYDADGNLLWFRSFGGPDWEETRSVGVDPSGRAHLAGYVYYPGGARPSDCFLLIYDAAGSIAWSRQVATPRGEDYCAAATDATGNFYMAGRVRNQNACCQQALTDIFLVKYDPNGNLLWARDPAIPNEESAPLIVVDAKGDVYVAGHSGDVFVVKFDGAGNRVWAREHGTGATDVATHLAPDPDGGVYVTAFTNNGVSFITRYGADGALLWNRLFDVGDRVRSFGAAGDRAVVYVVGVTEAGGVPRDMTEPKQGGSDAFLAKFSREGTLLSVRLLGSPSGTVGFLPVIGSNGGVYVLAGTDGGLPGIPNAATILARHREATP